jgi:lipopolysaccharide/colanic/teichoic acid biosynthesis glycosyltransferase
MTLPFEESLRRAVDVAVAGTALVLSSPVLAVAALAVRLETPGGVIYRQRRVGRDGVEFDVLKLRTMVDGAEHIGAGLAVDHGDSRITRVGALLRRTSLDELPNLLNVLRGDMGLIGPRPTLPHQVAQYTPRQRGRLAIRPGITGWAQVNGRTSLPWSERIELDLWYIEHRSVRLDVQILRRTVRMVFHGEGLYKGKTGGWTPPGGSG